jgi:Protein NO VEIN, C-terminal
MLGELLKHDNLGNEHELGYVLFQALHPADKQRLSDVTFICTSNIFSISRSINGIIGLLDFLSIIEINGDTLILNKKVFDPKDFKSATEYFRESHFFDCIFKRLHIADSIKYLFNQDNLKFSHNQNQYYVKSHLIKLDLFPIRNLLLALGFLEQNQTVPDHLYINSHFSEFFKKTVIDGFEERTETKKITLKQLKKSLDRKDEAGKEGELFVLRYEQARLKDHPNFDKIELISETYVNAGYDILSFNDMDSFIHDRFIEVKSYSGEIAFYWSKNEVKKAKRLKDKYYLYLVDRYLMPNSEYVPKIFRNPYKKIFENDVWKKETENWKITIEDRPE